jgi:hypothetical protein
VTIQTARYQPRGRRLADAPRAGKKIGVMKPIVLQRILERTRQHFLTRYILKFLWTPLAGDNLVRHESCK